MTTETLDAPTGARVTDCRQDCQHAKCELHTPAKVHITRTAGLAGPGEYYCAAHALEHYQGRRYQPQEHVYTPLPGVETVATRLQAWGLELDAKEWRAVTEPLWAPIKPYRGPRDGVWRATPLPTEVRKLNPLGPPKYLKTTRKTATPRKRAATCCPHCGGAL